MARSRRTPAVLILPMLFGAFQPTSPHRAARYGLPPGAENQGLARVRRLNLYSRQPYRRALASPATWISVSCNITIKCVSQQILLSGFGGRKAPSSMGKISTAEVLRLRAASAVSRDQSVRRSAQDDDSVGVLTKNTLNKLALVGRRPG